MKNQMHLSDKFPILFFCNMCYNNSSKYKMSYNNLSKYNVLTIYLKWPNEVVTSDEICQLFGSHFEMHLYGHQ